MHARLQQFRFDWKFTLIAALLFPLLISLGLWQLEREQEKLQLQQQYTARQQQAPVDLAMLDPGDDLLYRQVQARGTFDNAHVFLLDNRIYQGRPGYEVLIPMFTTPGQLAFINRGWVPQGQYRTDLPQIDAIEGIQEVRGTLYAVLGEQLVLGPELAAGGWPKVIQRVDVAAMAALAGYDPEQAVFPYTIRLPEGAADVPPGYWPVVSMSPEMHRGYAVQWFAMAAALLGLYFYYSTRPPHADAADDSLPR